MLTTSHKKLVSGQPPKDFLKKYVKPGQGRATQCQIPALHTEELGKEELPSAKSQHSTLKSPGPRSGAFWHADDANPSNSMVLHFSQAGLVLSLIMVAVDAGAGIPYRVQ